jgi:hypothetical protein
VCGVREFAPLFARQTALPLLSPPFSPLLPPRWLFRRRRRLPLRAITLIIDAYFDFASA